MSLVLGAITNNYVLFCSDQRASDKEGVRCENYKKIIKINDTCMIGFAGNIKDLVTPLEGILTFDRNDNERASTVDTITHKSYEEIVSKFTEQFEYSSKNVFSRDSICNVMFGGLSDEKVIMDVTTCINFKVQKKAL